VWSAICNIVKGGDNTAALKFTPDDRMKAGQAVLQFLRDTYPGITYDETAFVLKIALFAVQGSKDTGAFSDNRL
jgi:hypothetical protein